MSEYKMLPKYKKFNGITYTWENEVSTKSNAETEAKRLRDRGIKARVVKGGSFGWAYTIYIKK
jgi:predicted Zn-dependent protease